jgi:hypothetical protein
MKITADASGVSKGLSQTDRALQQLSQQATASSSLFDKFVGSTAGAAAAQRQFATDVAFLTSELKRGLRAPEEFAAEFAKLQSAARDTAAAFAEGQSITEQFATSQETQTARLKKLSDLYELGAFNLTTLNRASSEALGIDKQAADAAKQRADAVAKAERAGAASFDAGQARDQAAALERVAEAERKRAAVLARAAQITESVLTPLERYNTATRELVSLKQAGEISENTFNLAVAKSTREFVRAESAAKGYDKAVAAAGAKGNLAFNELAGTLAILPGPIGNVAGRLSGISSAAEGLNRIFSNGGGVGQFGTALAGLLNPTTLALGALAGLGAGAVAVGRSLVQLEGEVERLGQLADRLGVSFGFIQVLETAANQTGGSVENLGVSFTKFLRTVDDARQGGKNAAEAFRDLGLSAEDVRASNPEQLFTQAAQAIAEISDPARRAAAAVALFGKSGAELLPVFRQIGEAAADLERIGGALTQDQRTQIDEFGNALDRLGVASQGLKRQLTANFAGIGKTVADETAEAVGALNRFIRDLDDVASDKTWAGFQKSADRLKFDREIIASREQVANSLQEGKTNAAIAELVLSLGLAGDGTVQLSGELAKAQAQAASLGNEGTRAFLAFVKSLEDVAAAAEGAGLSEDQLAAAVANSRKDFEDRIAILGQEAEAQKKAADDVAKAADKRLQAANQLAEADRRRADAFLQQNGLASEANAADDLLAIIRQIEQAEKAIGEARAANDKAGELNAVKRLRALDQAKAAAQDNVAFGFNENDIARAVENARSAVDEILVQALDFGAQGAEAAKQFEQAFANSRRNLELKLVNPQQFDEAVEGQRKLFADRIRQLEEVRGLELQLINEKADLEQSRVRELVAARSQPLQLADVRTTEGQRQLLASANVTEDPAFQEYRLARLAIERLERKIEVARKVEIK